MIEDREELSFFEHDLSGLNDRADRITNLQFHFVGAAAADDALDDVVAHMDYDVGHYVTKGDLGDFADQTIAG